MKPQPLESLQGRCYGPANLTLCVFRRPASRLATTMPRLNFSILVAFVAFLTACGLSERERAVAKVRTGAIEDIDGSLDANKIARVVRRKARAVQDCYERALIRNPRLKGKLEIEVTVGENGRVETAEVIGNSVGSDEVAKCAIARIRRWKFPKPDGGSVSFVVPFNFISGS